MSRASRVLKTTGRIVKLIVALVIGLVIGLLAWRLTADKTPRSMTTLTVNDPLYTAYCNGGESLTLYTQEQNTITRAEHNAGYFSVLEDVLIPEANQIQLVFRYNDSTIRALAKDKNLAEVPPRDAELYDVTLLLGIDLTPDDLSDNSGNDPKSVRFVRVHAVSEPTVERTQLHNYRRFVFDLDQSGEDLASLMESGLLLSIFVDVYYNQEIDYQSDPYGVLCIYDYKTKTEEVKLTRHDRKAFADYGG